MITEKGKLALGLEHEGKTHKEYELRPLFVRDSFDIAEQYERSKTDDNYMGLCVLASQIVRLGQLSGEKITPDLLMGLADYDLRILIAAQGALDGRLGNFRSPAKDVA